MGSGQPKTEMVCEYSYMDPAWLSLTIMLVVYYIMRRIILSA